MVKVDNTMNDYLQQAEELAHFGQTWELDPSNMSTTTSDTFGRFAQRSAEAVKARSQPRPTTCGSSTVGRAGICPKLLKVTDVYYAAGVVAAKDGGAVEFDVGLRRNVQIAQGSVERRRELAADVVMTAPE
ncbi:hypothetical protein PC118_g14875 [Phytophthora cactorum]|uniref:Uncharacterized protein n=1 Tax=Phytophthora cactorum TaxID=29920 RepID=A0A8T1FQG0_9STRA|nr:hypothetical protein PC118_g14875 [Phytophthora cactorum]